MTRTAHVVLRVLLVLYVALTGVVIRLHPAGTGLDPSWAVGLNYLHANGYRHGRDVAFTYGPLSYLTLPMHFGSNLLQGALFQTAAWVVFSALLAWLVYARRMGLVSLTLFALLFYLGVHSFHRFGYAGPDVFVAYLAMLLLAGALGSRHWHLYYSAALMIAVFLSLIKWSTGLQALAPVLSFAVALAVVDRQRAIKAACIGFLGAPVGFALMYLIYNPSFTDLARYVRAGLELAAGHSAAQSSGEGVRDLIAALLIAAIYIGLLVWLYLVKQRSFVIGFALLPALFVEFKHSFIRYAGHIDIYFIFVPLVFGLVYLFTEFDRRSRWTILAIIPFLIAMKIRPESYVAWHYIRNLPRGIEHAKALRQVVKFRETRAHLRTSSDAALTLDRLPSDLLSRVGGNSITVFPWEVSYAAANPVRFVPFPIFSGFMAYTPYLDKWNAGFIDDPRRAPQFVLLEWMAVDGRNPLLDAPAAFTAMFRHYDFDSQYGGRVLLRRRPSPRFSHARFLRSGSVELGRPIRFEPARTRPLIARVDLRYNLRGRALRFLFRIPEMRASWGSDYGAVAARLSTEVAVDGLPLNFVPANLSEAVELFRTGRVSVPVDSLVISGPGSRNFSTRARVELYEFPEPALSYQPVAAAPDLAQLRHAGDALPSRIETLNVRGVTGIGPNEVIEVPDTLGYVQANGFAVDLSATGVADSVWIRLDGRLYPATYGLDNPGVAALLGNERYRASGFSWVYPTWKLGSGPHMLSLVVLLQSGQTYQEGSPIRFRMVPAAATTAAREQI